MQDKVWQWSQYCLETLDKFMLSYSFEHSLSATEYQHIMELSVEYFSIQDIY